MLCLSLAHNPMVKGIRRTKSYKSATERKDSIQCLRKLNLPSTYTHSISIVSLIMETPNPLEDTTELIPASRFAEEFFAEPIVEFDVTFGAATHIGKVRSENQDHHAIFRSRRAIELIKTDLPPDEWKLASENSYALVVADGMGGVKFGEFASRLALRRMFELVQQATSWVMKYTNMEVQQIRERVDAYVKEIQTTLRAYMDADPALAGMGTTWTSAHLLLPHVLVVHLGDSRAYLLQDGQLSQITHDETMAQAFVDSGMSSESVKRFRHILLNNFGGESDDVSASIHQLKVTAGDRLMLCTDGLSDMVPEEVMADIIRQDLPPQVLCDQLVDRALQHGGKDNITVVIASFKDSASA